MRGNAGASRGSIPARGCPEPSLFPAERQKRRPRPSVTKKLAELIGNDFKAVATALWPLLSVKSAEARLSHAISAEQGKRIGVDQVDTILEVLGPAREDEYWRWYCETRRRKYAERLPVKEWAVQAIARIEQQRQRRDEAAVAEQEELRQIREALEGSAD